MHTTFNQAVAATGRLSSSDPNLQNIPIRTELGPRDPARVRRRARLRARSRRTTRRSSCACSRTCRGDESLIEAFTRGEDIHDRTALEVFGAASGLDRYELRRRAKIINYALLYGKTAFTLAKDIGVTQQAAQAFIDAYFAGFPGVRALHRPGPRRRARDGRRSTTLWGRRRRVPEITSQNGQVRAAAERIAVNMPIQGTAADILKRAMIDVHAALHARPGRHRPRPHDPHRARRAAVRGPRGRGRGGRRDRARAHGARGPLAVPLTVDVGIGANWMEAK